jgi:cytochrome c oxidase subunit IV
MSHDAEHAHPITSPKTYLKIISALLVLTAITLMAARFDFGPWNTVIAILIASTKATLVAMFFMDLRRDKWNSLVFANGIFFLAVFLIFTLFDVDNRRYVLPSNATQAPKAFPGAPLNKPVQPSTGQPIPIQGS